MSVDAYAQAVESFERALARMELAKQAWDDAGQPIVVEHANRSVGIAPTLRALQSCGRDVSRTLAAIRITHDGPDPTAVVTAAIGESPAQELRRLRAVEPSG